MVNLTQENKRWPYAQNAITLTQINSNVQIVILLFVTIAGPVEMSSRHQKSNIAAIVDGLFALIADHVAATKTGQNQGWKKEKGGDSMRTKKHTKIMAQIMMIIDP
jgi:hypothetical protein